MKITESILKKLIIEAVWQNAYDYDYDADKYSNKIPKDLASNRVLFFDNDDRYLEDGSTHGRDSHALKHLVEFNPNIVRKFCNDIISYLQSIPGLNMRAVEHKSGNEQVINASDLRPGDIINTLDRINDDVIMEDPPLSQLEKLIYTTYFIPASDYYDSMVDEIIKNAIDVNDSNFVDPKKLVAFLEKTPTITFLAIYKGYQGEVVQRYYYDISTTAMCGTTEDGKATTLMRRIKSASPESERHTAIESLNYFVASQPGSTKPNPSGYSVFIEALEILFEKEKARKEKILNQQRAEKLKKEEERRKKQEEKEAAIQSQPVQQFPWKSIAGQISGMYRNGNGAPIHVILTKINSRIVDQALSSGINYQQKTQQELEDWMRSQKILKEYYKRNKYILTRY